MIILQLLLYCLLFTVMVKLFVIGGAINGLYFYPKEVQDRAIALGMTDRETVSRKRKWFMTVFCLVMFIALVLIIGVWNGVSAFGTAYWQALLFLEVMNIYDGVVIDKLWVGHSRFWVLPGLEDMPFVQTWRQVLIKKEHHGAHLVCRSSSCGRDHYVDFLKESRGYCHEKSLCEVVICKAI